MDLMKHDGMTVILSCVTLGYESNVDNQCRPDVLLYVGGFSNVASTALAETSR